MTFNVSYIHKNLALRWLMVTNDFHHVTLKEYTNKSEMMPIIADIKASQVDYVGISVYIFNHLKTKAFIELLKKELPHIQIIVGGPEVTYTPQIWLDYGCDYVVQGDGEFAFWDIINNKELKGVSYQGHRDLHIIRTLPEALEGYPNPYFLDFDRDDEAFRYLYLEASRGCPFHCSYCVAGIDQGVFTFSLDYMLQVLKQLSASKVKQVKFLDRTFNTNVKRALSLIQALNDIEGDLSVQLEVEVSIWDDQLSEFFKNHGKRERFRFEVGVQTFNETTLKAIKRKQNNEKVEAVIQDLMSYGYVVHADLIAGLPLDSYDEFSASFRRLLSLFPSELQLGILKGLPGTSLKNQAQASGIQFDSLPPYAIVASQDLSQAQIRQLELAAIGVDKIYNKPLAKSLIKKLFDMQVDMLQYFYHIGHGIDALKQPYQVQDVVSVILSATPYLEAVEVLGYLANDFGRQSKMKVKTLPYQTLNQDDLKAMQADISKRLKQDVSQWRSNSWVYYAMLDDELGYQWIIYSHHKRYYYFKGAQFAYEEDHFTR